MFKQPTNNWKEIAPTINTASIRRCNRWSYTRICWHQWESIYYHDVTSSSANNTPPTGALKAAATPAAHPQVTLFKTLNQYKMSNLRGLITSFITTTVHPFLIPLDEPYKMWKRCRSIQSMWSYAKATYMADSQLIFSNKEQIISRIIYKVAYHNNWMYQLSAYLRLLLVWHKKGIRKF